MNHSHQQPTKRPSRSSHLHQYRFSSGNGGGGSVNANINGNINVNSNGISNNMTSFGVTVGGSGNGGGGGGGGGGHSGHSSINFSSTSSSSQWGGWLCWTIFVATATLLLTSVIHTAPLHILHRRKRRALESARTMDRVHYDDFVNYVRMVDYCGSACYRTKTEALRACWDKVRHCRVHFCRLENEFGRMCKPIPGAWLPSSSPRPSPSPSPIRPLTAKEIAIADLANRPESPCKFKESMTRVGKSMVFRVECACDNDTGSRTVQQFNASSDDQVGHCLHTKFNSMSTSLNTACRAQRNDSSDVYDWAFDNACSMCKGYRPRPTRCNLNI